MFIVRLKMRGISSLCYVNLDIICAKCELKKSSSLIADYGFNKVLFHVIQISSGIIYGTVLIGELYAQDLKSGTKSSRNSL